MCNQRIVISYKNLQILQLTAQVQCDSECVAKLSQETQLVTKHPSVRQLTAQVYCASECVTRLS